MARAVELSECSTTKMEKAAAVSLLHQEPSFSERFTAHLLSRNIEIEEDLVDQLALQPRTAEEEQIGRNYSRCYLYLPSQRSFMSQGAGIVWRQ